MTLRHGIRLGLLSGAAVLLGTALIVRGFPWWVFGCYLLIGFIATYVDASRYQKRVVGTRFVSTPERFEDPVSGELLRVYVDAKTGERDYRPDLGPPKGLSQ